MPEFFNYYRGESAILVSFPHDGTEFPPPIKRRLNRHGINNTDCDWHISELYQNVLSSDISRIKARFSRYVVDLNRPSDGGLLYPGRMETGICPLTTFDGIPIYLPGEQPGEYEIRTRIETYWQPYHDRLQSELKRIRDRHGYAILWEAHSIRGQAPELFDGELPDLNFGTAGGRSCGEMIIAPLVKYAGNASDYSVTFNGRFKGGYITRHYGEPEEGIHAIQLEINQNSYLVNSEQPEIHQEKALQLSRLLKALIELLPKSVPGSSYPR